MNSYIVTARFRPNANRAECTERRIVTEAKNREDAAFIAGNRIGQQGTGLVNVSLELDIERLRKL